MLLKQGEQIMRNFFGNLGYKIRQWMQGRYGTDEFNRFLSVVAIIFLVASLFGRLWYPLMFLYIPGVLLLGYTIFRTLSKNLYARSKERDFYVRVKGKISGFFRLQKRRWNERGTSRFYKCPKCRATVRVPKGRGRIEITCPKCRERFVKRT